MTGCRIGQIKYKAPNVKMLPPNQPANSMVKGILLAARAIVDEFPDLDSYVVIGWTKEKFRVYDEGTKNTFDLPARAAETIRYSWKK